LLNRSHIIVTRSCLNPFPHFHHHKQTLHSPPQYKTLKSEIQHSTIHLPACVCFPTHPSIPTRKGSNPNYTLFYPPHFLLLTLPFHFFPQHTPSLLQCHYIANILNPLFEAEAEVTKQVQLAEQQARQKVQQAEVDAEREYQKLKKEEETKFQQEELQFSGKGDASVQAVVQKVEVQKKQQQQMYDKNQESVVQLLLHQVTSAEIKLSEPQRQAFLAIKRQKEAASASSEAY